MSRFAETDHVGVVVDAIARLVPHEKLTRAASRIGTRIMHSEEGRFKTAGTISGVNPATARWGRETSHGTRSEDTFSHVIPRNWTANISEPYMATYRTRDRTTAEKRVTRTANSFGWDGRPIHAKFATYGLDVYKADQDYKWGQLDWNVVETAQDPNSLGVFAANPYFTNNPRYTAAIIESGDAVYDTVESFSLVQSGITAPFGIGTPEIAARRNSLRLTDQGVDRLLVILETTRAVHNSLTTQ